MQHSLQPNDHAHLSPIERYQLRYATTGILHEVVRSPSSSQRMKVAAADEIRHRGYVPGITGLDPRHPHHYNSRPRDIPIPHYLVGTSIAKRTKHPSNTQHRAMLGDLPSYLGLQSFGGYMRTPQYEGHNWQHNPLSPLYI